MFVGIALYRQHRATVALGPHLTEAGTNEMVSSEARASERGAAIVEWLGISALSVGLLVVIFQGMTAIGLDLVESIRSQLGL